MWSTDTQGMQCTPRAVHLSIAYTRFVPPWSGDEGSAVGGAGPCMKKGGWHEAGFVLAVGITATANIHWTGMCTGVVEC